MFGPPLWQSREHTGMLAQRRLRRPNLESWHFIFGFLSLTFVTALSSTISFVDNKNLKGFQIVIGKMIQTPSTLSNQKPINFEEKEKKDKSQSELIRNQSKDKQLKL